MNFFDVPSEVISHHVLGNLQLNDLLSLRRVSKVAKELSDDYIRLHVKIDKEIRVSSFDGYQEDFEEDTPNKCISMSSLMGFDLPLPSSRFMLAFNFEENVFEDPEWKLEEFVERFGKQITHLKVTHMTAPMTCEKEFQFYEGFPNLTHLSVGYMNMVETDELNENSQFTFPSTFRNLKHFSLKTFFVIGNIITKKYFWSLINHCENLESLGHPFYDVEEMDEDDGTQGFAAYSFNRVTSLILERKRIPNGPIINSYDLDGMSGYFNNVDSFVDPERVGEFFGFCVENNIRLHNVYTHFLEELELVHLQTAAKCIVSIKGVAVECFAVDYPLVEKITVDTRMATLRNSAGETWEDFGPPIWPALKTLDVTVNSPSLRDGYQTVFLFQLLFTATHRPTLAELNFIFEPFQPNGSMDDTPMPRTRAIITTCANLRKLTMCNWNGTNKAISLLWTLRHLEEVSFDNCKTLDNVAFVGEETENPTFLNLKNMKKLSLLHMDEMPKLTDTVFELVFKHVQLRELRIEAFTEDETTPNKIPKKLKSITSKGIEALLTGEFAKSIRSFPFDCWALEDATDEEFKSLRDQFRSSNLT